MIKVTIKDFQSIDRAVFTVDRYTVLHGKSNIGKSAAVRAVKAALTGCAGTAFVRHGGDCLRRVKKSKTCKCFASVHLESEGFDLLWEKGDSINRYVYNGQTYDRVDKGVPEFLSEAFSLVKVGDHHESIQCSDQFFPIFLLNQSANTIAEVLSDVANLDRINVAAKLAEKDRRDAAATRKVREKDVETLTTRLGHFESLDGALGGVQEAGVQFRSLEGKQEEFRAIEGYLSRTQLLGSSVLRLRKVCQCSPPSTEELPPLSEQLHLLDRLSVEFGSRSTSVQFLQGIGVVNVSVEEGPQLAASVRLLTNMGVWLNSLLVKHTGVVKLRGVGNLDVPETSELSEAWRGFDSLQDWAVRGGELSAFLRRFGDLAEMDLPDSHRLPDVFDQWRILWSLSSQYQALEATISKLRDDLTQVEMEESNVHEEIQSLGTCPVCTRPFGGGAPCHA